MDERESAFRRKQYHEVMQVIKDVGGSELTASQYELFRKYCDWMDSYIDSVEDYIEAHDKEETK